MCYFENKYALTCVNILSFQKCICEMIFCCYSFIFALYFQVQMGLTAAYYIFSSNVSAKIIINVLLRL